MYPGTCRVSGGSCMVRAMLPTVARVGIPWGHSYLSTPLHQRLKPLRCFFYDLCFGAPILVVWSFAIATLLSS